MQQEGEKPPTRLSFLKRKRRITDDEEEDQLPREESRKILGEIDPELLSNARPYCKPLEEPHSSDVENNQLCTSVFGLLQQEDVKNEQSSSMSHQQQEDVEIDEDLCSGVLSPPQQEDVEYDEQSSPRVLDQSQEEQLLQDVDYCKQLMKRLKHMGDSSTSDSIIQDSPETNRYSELLDDVTPLDYVPPSTWSQFRRNSCMLTPVVERASPLPHLMWASADYLWEVMCRKDELLLQQRDEDVFSRHPALQARMRSILLDWIIEVCEVYRLHRETYHLAMDFLDRYLSIQNDIPKQQLQLIGITCLFIAAKLEEIYPPKINEFAYVTDGACTESEITEKEIVVLKALNWRLSAFTANSWLNTYMQLYCTNQSRIRKFTRSSKPNHNFHLPQYSGMAFSQTAQLIDLCMLDVTCFKFSYSVIAASALYHIFNRELALFVSGYQWDHISACVDWMSAFAITIREEDGLHQGIHGPNTSPSIIHRGSLNIVTDESHKLQKHVVDLVMLEKAQKRLANLSSPDCSPTKDVLATTSAVLTPPSSHKKPINQC